jgi:hypothetical protein
MVRLIRFLRSPLIAASLLCCVGLCISLILWQVDNREWLGVNVWIKPVKFFSSIAIYLSTLHFYIGWIEGHPRLKQRLAWFAILSMSIELLCIVLQSARGVGSHFNTALPLDGLIYGVMGVFAFAQIPLAAILFFYLWKHSVPLAPNMRVGIFWGLSVFLLGCVQAGFMASGSGHSVGGSGGASLPFLGWSLEYGDLRVAHFVGLHGLQIFALLGFLFRSRENKSYPLHAIGGMYFLWVFFLWWQALAGKSVFLLGN